MKRLLSMIFVFTTILIGLSSTTEVKAAENNTIIYFYSPSCLGCLELEEQGYLEQIENAGIIIHKIDISGVNDFEIPANVIYNEDERTPSAADLLVSFGDFYSIPVSDQTTPLMIVGDNFYTESEIKRAITSGDFFDEVKDDFLTVDVEAGQAYESKKTLVGFLGVLGAGLLDGFNPCAIALLLMFISLIGFTEDKRLLIVVSITYIFTMFLTYFLIGLGALSALQSIVTGSGLDKIMSWIVFFIVLLFFILNVYDFFVTRNEEYGKVKSQLPKWIQRMNKRILKTFTVELNEKGEKGKIVPVILLTASLGIIMTFTEFLCSGVIYYGVIDGIKYFKEFYAYFLIFMFNVMFVMPMVVIAVLAVKSKSIMGVSNWIREHMSTIKLLNSIVFLILLILFASRLF